MGLVVCDKNGFPPFAVPVVVRLSRNRLLLFSLNVRIGLAVL